jgi:hypothetical protein
MKKIIFIVLLAPAIFFACKKTSTDKTAPVITLKGSLIVPSPQDSIYVDAGAMATDDVDGDITSKIVVVNPVNIHIVGTYFVTYNVTDNAGNKAAEVKREVKVLNGGF